MTIFRVEKTCDNTIKNNLCKTYGNKLKCSSNPKLLSGVTLDEQLEVQQLVNMNDKNASKTDFFREVNGISTFSRKKLIELYMTGICSLTEYGSSLW